MADITTKSTNNTHKKAGVPKSKKHNTRVDLTPMVDLGFLLITFFVFTTTLSSVKAMAMYEPKAGNEIPVKQSGTTTILLGKNNQVYYYFGTLKANTVSEQFKISSYANIRKIITNKKKATKLSDLMFITKADSGASFKNVIDILDEMVICAVPAGHYAEVEITAEEQALIRATEIANGMQ
jgi:biopolymer transport protein ExbD